MSKGKVRGGSASNASTIAPPKMKNTNLLSTPLLLATAAALAACWS